MARIKVEVVGEGQHPSEVIIAVKTADGVRENVIVDKRSLEHGTHDTIDVGYPVGGDDKRYLVELPRETANGQWRLWMKKEDVLERTPA